MGGAKRYPSGGVRRWVSQALNPSYGARQLQPAEPVVALVLPIAAEIFVGDGELDYVLGVLEAELGGDADAQREAEAARQDFAVEPHRQLRLRMQRGRHVDR